MYNDTSKIAEFIVNSVYLKLNLTSSIASGVDSSPALGTFETSQVLLAVVPGVLCPPPTEKVGWACLFVCLSVRLCMCYTILKLLICSC